MRLEVNPSMNQARLTARSRHGAVADALVKTRTELVRDYLKKEKEIYEERAADAAGRARHQHRRAGREAAVLLEVQHALHGGKTRGAWV